jgi:release factor glutamine methyltransferase
MGSTARRLRECGIPDAEKEAELILTIGTGIDRAALYGDNPAASDAQLRRVEEFVRRRAGREPLQYILGEVEFLGLSIKVGPGVLVPRPETELLVVEALRLVSGKRRVRALDLCTGSGCIALALSRALPDSEIHGTDTSREALRYARLNARTNGAENVTFLKGNLFEPLRDLTFDLITANPPYVRSGDIQCLEPEVRDWEPLSALDGGEDGLDIYRELLGQSPSHLAEDGALVLEMGCGQAPEVAEIARAAMPGHRLSVLRDYAGIKRLMVVRPPGHGPIT